MELNALQRWQSVGRELNKLGQLDQELEKLESTVKNVDRERRNSRAHSEIGWPPRTKSLSIFIARAIRRFAKGFGVGYGIFTFINIIRGLLDFIKFLKAPTRQMSLSSWLSTRLQRILFDKYAMRMGSFLGGFLSIFESTMRLSRYINSEFAGDLLTKVRYRTILAGSLAGISMLCVPEDSRVGIAVFVFVRALEISAKHAAESNWLPKIITSFNHPEVLMMSTASVQICWAAMYGRASMVPSYKHFMDVHSGQSILQRNAYGDLCNYGVISQNNLKKMNIWRMNHGFHKLNATVPTHEIANFACEIMHPANKRCEAAATVYFYEALGRAVGVYVPVYLIPLIIFQHKKLRTKPLQSLMRAGLGIARSTAFLASYCTMGWASVCFLRHWITSPNVSMWHVFFSGACAGSMVIVEAKQRRLELALYVFAQAIQSFYSHWHSKGVLGALPYGSVLLFSASMSIMMHAYINRPRLMRQSYFGAFRFFFGSGGVTEGFPKEIVHKKTSKSLTWKDDNDENKKK